MRTTDIDGQETREWVEALDSVVEHDGPERAGDLLDRVLEHARDAGDVRRHVTPSSYVNTIPPDREPAVPGRPRARAPDPRADPLERDGDRAAGQRRVVGAGRAHRQLPVGRDALRGRLPPLLARPERRARRRPRLHAGPLVARRLRARVPRGAPEPRGGPARLPPGGLARRALLLPAPVADAGLLAVPDRLDGPRADHGDLPGAVHEVPEGPRPDGHDRAQGVGVPRRRRDRRAGVAGRDLARRPRAARQPRLRHQLQPAAARRAGARQRQDHPGARDVLPRRGLERAQGDLGLASGTRCSPPTTTACCGARMDEAVDGEYQTFKSRDGAYVREHFFGAYPELLGARRGHDRRRDLGAQPRRPRPGQGPRRLRRRDARRRAGRR